MNLIIKRFEELETLELYNILKLRAEIFVVEQECAYQDIDDKDKFAYHMFYKDNEQNIIAYLRILDENQRFDCISIGRLVVKDSYRLKGLATDIMSCAIKYITSDLNKTTIKISAQVHLKNFYSSLGFKQCSDMYLEDGIKHIEMVFNNLLDCHF